MVFFALIFVLLGFCGCGVLVYASPSPSSGLDQN
jgi:hypothetical protein